ncbi:MAG: hypothetical protein Q9166_007977 [cf. Caloplaca sp. 2 TL-2023]
MPNTSIGWTGNPAGDHDLPTREMTAYNRHLRDFNGYFDMKTNMRLLDRIFNLIVEEDWEYEDEKDLRKWDDQVFKDTVAGWVKSALDGWISDKSGILADPQANAREHYQMIWREEHKRVHLSQYQGMVTEMLRKHIEKQKTAAGKAEE